MSFILFPENIFLCIQLSDLFPNHISIAVWNEISSYDGFAVVVESLKSAKVLRSFAPSSPYFQVRRSKTRNT